ncbi:MAG: TIGR03943 family protein [Chloroflexi bacterium]|nr:TIGR03943 family protein [Chloroflexota bacterium]
MERLRAREVERHIDIHRFLPAFLLAGYGIFILSLFARNVMSLYINPGYIGPTTLAGAVLVGLSAVRFAGASSRTCEEGCCATDGCGCDTQRVPGHPRLWTYALLSLPLLLAAAFPPRGLATFSANQRGPQIAGMTVVHGSTVKRVSLSVDTRSFGMMDWVGALSADPNPRDYLGKPVQVSGLVLHSSDSVPSGYFMVMRYVVTCCIADARPVGLAVQDTSHGALRDNQWVTVTGTMGMADDSGQKIAVVKPSKIELTRAGNPYIY